MTRRKSRRILFVTGSFVVGGAERQLAMLAGHLVERGWTVSVFGLEKAGPLVDTLENQGIRVLDGGYRQGASAALLKLLLLLFAAIRLVGYALAERPGVLHCYLPVPNFFGAVAGRIAFVPLIVTGKRSLGMHQERHPGWKWLDRVANALSHVVTANSRAVARDTQLRDGYDLSRIVVVPNGLDFAALDNVRQFREEVRQELRIEATDVALVTVANFIPYKGHKELIDAFARVAAADRRLKLFLVGEDRGIGQELREQAKGLGIADKVMLLGQRADVPRLLAAMDVGVLPSHEEGLSNALLEKLAAGLPVVATDVGGNPEALEGMPGCVLVRPRDPEDLARGLREVIAAQEGIGTGAAIRKDLVRRRYSVDAMVDAYERLYSESNKAVREGDA